MTVKAASLTLSSVSTPLDPAPPNAYADFAPDAHAPAAAEAVIDPDDPPWGVGAGLFVWFASVVLMLMMSLAAVVVYVLLRGVPTPDNANLSAALQNDPNLTLYSLLSMIPTHALTLLLVWAVVTNFGKRPFWRTVGWDWSPRLGPWSSVGLAVLLLALSFTAVKLFGSGVKTQLDEMLESSAGARFVTAFLAVAGAPLVEELVYRGVLYPSLRRGIARLAGFLRAALNPPPNAAERPDELPLPSPGGGPAASHTPLRMLSTVLTFNRLSPERAGMWWAVLIVATLFAVVHVAQYYNNPAVIFAVGSLGFVLTYVRARTGRVLPCFVIHLVFNGIQSALLVADHFVEKPAEVEAQAGIVALALRIVTTLLP